MLAVPDTSIITTKEQKFVSVLSPDGTRQMRPVVTGFSRDGWTMIREGLAGGERIAVTGQEEGRP